MKTLSIKGLVRLFHERHKLRPDKPFCFVLGAGASRPSGVQTGAELVRQWLRELQEDRKGEHLELEQWATAANLGILGFDYARAPDFYSHIYEQRFPVAEDGFAFLEGLMAGKVPSFGYSVLAHFLSVTKHQVVITTNFDNLVANALSIHSDTFPRVVGHEELVRFVGADLRRPLVVKIHGDLGFILKNTPGEVAKLSDEWAAALHRVFTRFTPIFIGYSGSDGSLMDFLLGLEKGIPDTLFWCWRSGSPPTDKIQQVVERHSGVCVEIEGFDEIMLRLFDGLETRPDLVADLERRSYLHLEGYKRQRAELGEKLARESPRGSADKQPSATSVEATAAESRGSLLGVASRVLAEPSQPKTWWQWQLEIDQESTVDSKDLKYQAAVLALPDQAPLLGNYAVFLARERKDFDRAEEFFKRAIAVDPNHANSLGGYAWFLAQERKDFDKAEEFFKRAIAVDPNDAISLCNYANLLAQERKDFDRAEEFFNRAIAVKPNDVVSLRNYANLLAQERKDFDRAEEFFNRAIAVDPNDAISLHNYAVLLRRMGR